MQRKQRMVFPLSLCGLFHLPIRIVVRGSIALGRRLQLGCPWTLNSSWPAVWVWARVVLWGGYGVAQPQRANQGSFWFLYCGVVWLILGFWSFMVEWGSGKSCIKDAKDDKIFRGWYWRRWIHILPRTDHAWSEKGSWWTDENDNAVSSLASTNSSIHMQSRSWCTIFQDAAFHSTWASCRWNLYSMRSWLFWLGQVCPQQSKLMPIQSKAVVHLNVFLPWGCHSLVATVSYEPPMSFTRPPAPQWKY